MLARLRCDGVGRGLSEERSFFASPQSDVSDVRTVSNRPSVERHSRGMCGRHDLLHLCKSVPTVELQGPRGFPRVYISCMYSIV